MAHFRAPLERNSRLACVLAPERSICNTLAVEPELDTTNFALSVDVPMPTLPWALTIKSVEVADAVEEPIAKSVVFVSPLFAWIESLENGEVEPTPTLPVGVMKSVEVPEMVVPSAA